MDRAINLIERGILVVLAVLLSVIIAGVSIQVFLRYAFGLSFLWGEEVAIYAFVWCIFLGGAINVWRRSNFAFDSISTMLRGRWATAHRLLIDLVILICSAIIAWQGMIYALLSIKRLSPALGFSLFVPTLAIPVSALLMIVAAAVHIVGDVRAFRTAGPRSNP